MSDKTTAIEEMTNLTKRLKASPIFHMSLGSKELFHSNFLAWLTETYREEMSTLFAGLLDSSTTSLGKLICVEREKRNIDLAITFADARIIIENKVKSVPYPEQLKKYKINEDEYREKEREKEYRKKGEEPGAAIKNLYILLTINPPTFEVNDWSVLTYQALAKALEKLKTDNIYHQSLLDDYIQYLQCLNEIMKLFRFDDSSADQLFLLKKQDSKKQDSDILKELRLFDMVAKYRAAQVEQILREAFSTQGIDIAFSTKFSELSVKNPLVISHGFSNQSAFVAFNCLYTSNPKSALGILVQDNKLCWAVERGAEDKCAALYEELVLQPNARWTKKSLLGNENEQYKSKKLQSGKKYRKFGGFLYDYVIIPDDATLEDIVAIIETGIISAIELSRVIK